MEYIILNDNKTPVEEISAGGHPLDEVKDFDNIGVLIPEPFIVLDFDNAEDAKIAHDIIVSENIKCKIMQTTRGYHFWFKSAKPWKNFVKSRLAIGLYADCRSWGKTSYVVIKQKGKWRDWIKDTPLDEVEEVPIWLNPVVNGDNFKNMSDGDGRNDSLFRYILTLQRRGFKVEEVKTTLNIINDYVLKDSFTSEEMSLIMRDEAFISDKEVQLAHCFDEKGNLIHNIFADELIERYNIVTLNNQMYVYEDGYYVADNFTVEKAMIDLLPSIKQKMRQEVLSYITIKTSLPSRPSDEPYTINIINGRLNTLTGELLEHSPKYYDFERVPIIYDPDIYDKHVDKMLNKVFCYDEEVRLMFEEMLGYCLTKSTKHQIGFMFFGEGSNGKSTVLTMIREFIGRNNISAIELDKLHRRFVTAELENKLVNIGDDVNEVTLNETGTIKKLFTGDALEVDRKYGGQFKLFNHAKMLFSCNRLPHSNDKSDGFYRRFVLVPFNAKFSTSDADYDPDIESKVTSDNAKSYLLNLALNGLARLNKRGRFIEPKVVKDAKEMYKTINSSVLTWMEEETISLEMLLSQPIAKLYSDYTDYCTVSGVKHKTTRTNFTKELSLEFKLVSKPKWIEGKSQRMFVKEGE